MKDSKTCIRCGLPNMLIPNKREPLSIDNEGVCVFCRDYERVLSLQNAGFENRKEKLDNLINSTRGKNKYDAVVMFTGGKDSAYSACLLAKDYGLTVLALTWDNGFFGDHQRSNIERIVSDLEIDHRFISIGNKVLTEFYQNRLKHYGRFCSCLLPSLFFCASEIVDVSAPLIFISASFGQILGTFQNMIVHEEKDEKSIQAIGNRWSGTDLSIISMKNDYFTYAMLRDIVVGDFSDATVEKFATCVNSMRRLKEKDCHIIHLMMCMDCSSETMIDKISKYGWTLPDGSSKQGHTSCIMEPMKGYLACQQGVLNPDMLELAANCRAGRMTKDEAAAEIPHLGYFSDEPQDCTKELLKATGLSIEEFREILASRPYARKTVPEINRDLVARLPLDISIEELEAGISSAYRSG